MAAVCRVQREGSVGLLDLDIIVEAGEGLRNARGWFRCLMYVRDEVLDMDWCLLWLMTVDG